MTMLALTIALLPVMQQLPEMDPWIPLRPTALRSEAGAELALRPDASVFVTGVEPATDVYELQAEVGAGALIALRLEAIPDSALPLSGASRSANANFCISEIEVFVSAPKSRKKPQAVRFRAVHQTRGDRGTARRLIDGNRSSSWVVHASSGEPSVVVLVAEAPFGFEKGTELTVRIRQESQWSNHGLGSFRLAVTEDAAAADSYAAKLDPVALRADAATWKGIQFLLTRQHPDGTWFDWLEPEHPGGMTSLCAYSLYKAGMPREHAALQLALAYLDTHPAEYTYDAALRILLYTSLDPERWRERIEQAAEVMMFVPDMYFTYKFAGGTGSGGDLSNHQFATVALHALDDHGFKIDKKLWQRLAERIISNQNDDGSFGYHPESGATPTMALAGLAVAAACRNAYERNGLSRKDQDVLRKAVDAAVAYCGANWLLDQPRNTGPLDRWFYYACYGMERAAALAGVEAFDEHDWYAEVATELCDVQNGDGSWHNPWGEHEMNTAFALLTLARATAATGMPSISARFAPRWSNAGTGAELAITAVGAPELQLYLAGVGKKVVEDFAWPGEERPRVLQVQWLLNGVPAGEPVVNEQDPAVAARGMVTPRFAQRLSLPGNGDYEVIAVALLIPPGFPPEDAEELRSAPLKLEVRGLADAPVQAEIEFMRREAWIFPPDFRDLSASSSHDASKTAPGLAFDRAQNTRWSCAADDKEPWIRAEWKRAVPVGAMRLLPALTSGRLADGSGFDLPRKVLLILNGKDERILEFGPAEMLTGITIEFERKLNLRRVEIRVLEREVGVEHPGLVGWREIQFFAP
ncbi:MAG: terpene cyclase/mutase family protein [Planctomycetota bacterium]|nr:terpene cyclase/mutase family protein [Planctomycetota bacterium]